MTTASEWKLQHRLEEVYRLADFDKPIRLDDKDPDTWVCGDDTAPWVDDPAADYVFDPPQLRDPL